MNYLIVLWLALISFDLGFGIPLELEYVPTLAWCITVFLSFKFRKKYELRTYEAFGLIVICMYCYFVFNNLVSVFVMQYSFNPDSWLYYVSTLLLNNAVAAIVSSLMISLPIALFWKRSLLLASAIVIFPFFITHIYFAYSIGGVYFLPISTVNMIVQLLVLFFVCCVASNALTSRSIRKP